MSGSAAIVLLVVGAEHWAALSNRFLKEVRLPSVKSSSQFAPGECGEIRLLRTNVLYAETNE